MVKLRVTTRVELLGHTLVLRHEMPTNEGRHFYP